VRVTESFARDAAVGKNQTSMSKDKSPIRVVVADDEPDAVLALRLLLQGAGHEVCGVGSGRRALDAVRDFGADVLLLDIGMPGMSGYDIAQELRQRYGSAKPLLIAVTGRNSPSDKALTRSLGFDHHIAKPYDPNALLALIAGARSHGAR